MKQIRYGISDIIVSEEESEIMAGYALIYDNEGNLLTEAEIYYIEEE